MIETVKIQDPNKPGDYIVINKSDLKDSDKLFEVEKKATRKKKTVNNGDS